MLKTFFEKVPLKDGDVLVNYTSSVKDATLERLFRYTISRFDSSKVIAEAEDFTCLIQARNAAWSNLGNMIKLFSSRPVNGLDNEATESDAATEEAIDRIMGSGHGPLLAKTLKDMYEHRHDPTPPDSPFAPMSDYEREFGVKLPAPKLPDFPKTYRDALFDYQHPPTPPKSEDPKPEWGSDSKYPPPR